MGPSGALELPLPEGAGELYLELDLAPCVAPPRVQRQRLRIQAAGAMLAERWIDGHATLTLLLPPGAAAGGAVRLVLHHPDAIRPRDFGLNDDPRQLGFRLSRAQLLRVEEGPPRLPGPGTLMLDVEFGHAGEGDGILGNGWGEPEGRHVWSLGRHSELQVPCARRGLPHVLILDVAPFVEASQLPRQRLMIGANERLLATLALDRRVPLALALPRLAPGKTGWRLRFDNIDAAAARDFGRHADGRNQAFMLVSLRLIAFDPVAGTVPAPGAPTDDAELVRGFESLGHACDFDALQRELAEPHLGLLHLAGISTFGLVRGLAQGFWQLGREDRIEPVAREGDPQMWFHDTTYDLTGPTGMAGAAVSAAAMRRQMGRALPFLRQRLLQEISAGERIFLLRRPGRLLREEAEAVLATLRLHGDATLLWLVQDGSVPTGAVRRLGPRLLQGGLEAGDCSNREGWLAVLRAARELARA